MLAPSQHQSSIFYAAFATQADKIRDPMLDEIDELLDDDELLELVRGALRSRRPKSSKTGRNGIAPDRLLRCVVLKTHKDWSLRELERELTGNLIYRRFTRFDADPIPNFTTFSRNFALLNDEVMQKINGRVVLKAIEKKVAYGRRLRTDTTVVETNIHYPTDSTLLADGARVLLRAVRRVAKVCESGAVKVLDQTRAIKKQVIAIHHAARIKSDEGLEKRQAGYKTLLSLTGRVFRKAQEVASALASGKLTADASSGVLGVAAVMAAEAQIKHYVPLVKQVIAQTKARVFGGNNRYPGKILSIFEEHTQAICKGKAHKATEFGRLVRVDEVENGIVSGCEVLEGNPADQSSFKPALEQHKERFGRAPDLATADRGFFSAKNVREAEAMGVKKVALPARGKLSKKQRARQKERWFRRAQGWRAGIEARISTLKHRFGIARATFKGEHGFKRSVGFSVLSHNLVSMTRTLVQREEKKKKKKNDEKEQERRAA